MSILAMMMPNGLPSGVNSGVAARRVGVCKAVVPPWRVASSMGDT